MPPSAPPPGQTLAAWLGHEAGVDASLQALALALAGAAKEIAALVARGALAGVLGTAGSDNVQGEEQKRLDVMANDLLLEVARRCDEVAGAASEEMEEPVLFAREGAERGRHLILFDPLDGSSNIDVNASIGTIVSVLPAPAGRTPTAADFLQAGRRQEMAAYALYGPQTLFVLTVGRGVHGFTLDPDAGEWRLSHPDLRIAPATREFAVNMSNQRHWAAPIHRYVDELLAGRSGPRGKDFNMRWVAAMVADVHRILNRGGVFLYPWDSREPTRPGKLRLMYEANPLGWMVEAAGGAASDGTRPILDIAPDALHQRVAVVLGAAEEVAHVLSLQGQATS